MTARVQGGRTATPNAPPANNSLAPGELYVEMATPLRLWTGVPTGVAASGTKLVIDTGAQSAANAGAVQKTGDTMTGPLVLSGAPTLAAQAANMAYVDTQSVSTFNARKGVVTLTGADITGAGGALATSLTAYAKIDSQVFIGTPSLPAGAIAVTQAPGDADTSIATTAFVAAALGGVPGGAVIADVAPASQPGALWWDSVAGNLFVRYADANSTQWVAATNMAGLANAATQADVAAAQNNTGRNLVHNGTFSVAQRGAGPFTTQVYSLDRWGIGLNLDTINLAQYAISDAARAAIGDEAAAYLVGASVTGNAGAAALSGMYQSIEDVRRLSGKTVIISFWAAANSGTPKIGLSLDQYFGTGGSPSVSVNGAGVAVTINTSWARYSVTLTLASTSGKTLGSNANSSTNLWFWFSGGSSMNARNGSIGVQTAAFNLWGVQLEIAAPGQTQPTPLAKRDPADELALAQRFFYNGPFSAGGGNATGVGYITPISFPVTMRATPTIVVTPATVTNCTSQSVNAYNAAIAQVYAQCTTAVGYAYNGTFAASADL